jgi:hypothetical protein
MSGADRDEGRWRIEAQVEENPRALARRYRMTCAVTASAFGFCITLGRSTHLRAPRDELIDND